MKATARNTLWLGLFVVLCAAAMAAEEPKAAPAGNPAPQETAQPAQPGGATVEMAELTLEGKAVHGRVVSENDQVIRIEPFGAGVIGYPKANVSGLRRFTLTRGAYEEAYGDYLHEHAWDAEDAPAEFAKARQAYQRAVTYATSDADRLRLNAKLKAVAEEREEWQAEAVREAGIEKARQEAELIKLQRQLTEEKLAALRQQEADLRRLQLAFRDSQVQVQQLGAVIADLARRVDALERDVDELQRRETFFVTGAVFLDLKREHTELQRQVDRIERMIRR